MHMKTGRGSWTWGFSVSPRTTSGISVPWNLCLSFWWKRWTTKVGEMSQSPDGQAKPSTRPFILCFHHYQERERQLSNEVLKILIFPDFSARLMAKRSTYKKVKAQLHKKDIRFSLWDPAKLVVYFNGSRHSFSPAGAADTFFNQHLSSENGARRSSDRSKVKAWNVLSFTGGRCWFTDFHPAIFHHSAASSHYHYIWFSLPWQLITLEPFTP